MTTTMQLCWNMINCNALNTTSRPLWASVSDISVDLWASVSDISVDLWASVSDISVDLWASVSDKCRFVGFCE